jgi:hypothetical protein
VRLPSQETLTYIKLLGEVALLLLLVPFVLLSVLRNPEHAVDHVRISG